MNTRLPSHTRSASAARPSGFTLLECVIYGAVLLVILALALECFYRSWDYSKQVNRQADLLLRVLQTGERWRADVRKAVAPPQFSAEQGAERVRLIQATSEVIYVFADHRVTRQQLPSTNAATVLAEVLHSRMSKDVRSNVTACRWELELSPSPRGGRIKPLFTFYAVPRHHENAKP